METYALLGFAAVMILISFIIIRMNVVKKKDVMPVSYNFKPKICPICKTQIEIGNMICPTCKTEISGNLLSDHSEILQNISPEMKIPTHSNKPIVKWRLIFLFMGIALFISYEICSSKSMIPNFQVFISGVSRSSYSSDGVERIVENYGDYLMTTEINKARLIVLISGLLGGILGYLTVFLSNREVGK